MLDATRSIENAVESVNSASKQARNMWLAFIGLIAILFVTLTNLTDNDIFLENTIFLPITNVPIPFFSFFIFGPCLVILFHFGLLMQHAILAWKIAALESIISDDVNIPGRKREFQNRENINHPARSQLHSYSITQYSCRPDANSIIKASQWLIGWLTLITMPIAILLYFQLQFLPYQSHSITWFHRIVIALDIIILFLIGVSSLSPSSSLKEAICSVFNFSYIRVFVTIIMTIMILSFSMCIATIPGEKIEYLLISTFNSKSKINVYDPPVFQITRFFFGGLSAQYSNYRSRWFRRTLRVNGLNLHPEKQQESTASNSSFRGRNFRYASLYLSNLRSADLQQTDFTGSYFGQINLQGANLENSKLGGIHIDDSNLQGLSFRSSDLRGSYIFGSLLNSVDFTGAKLTAAIIGGSNLQGADFYLSKLHGTWLYGNSLQRASFYGADMKGANLSLSLIWQTRLPGFFTEATLTDFSMIQFEPPNIKAFHTVIDDLKRLNNKSLSKRLNRKFGNIHEDKKMEAWANSESAESWVDLAVDSNFTESELNKFLASLACSDGVSPHILRGMARRAIIDLMNKAMTSLASVLLSNNCTAGKQLDKESQKMLKKRAEYKPNDWVSLPNTAAQ